jgi:hypothetical protein
MSGTKIKRGAGCAHQSTEAPETTTSLSSDDPKFCCIPIPTISHPPVVLSMLQCLDLHRRIIKYGELQCKERRTGLVSMGRFGRVQSSPGSVSTRGTYSRPPSSFQTSGLEVDGR